MRDQMTATTPSRGGRAATPSNDVRAATPRFETKAASVSADAGFLLGTIRRARANARAFDHTLAALHRTLEIPRETDLATSFALPGGRG